MATSLIEWLSCIIFLFIGIINGSEFFLLLAVFQLINYHAGRLEDLINNREELPDRQLS